jgi:hypothetical protein
MTYYVLRALAAVGIVWDLHVPSQKVIDGQLEIKGKKPVRAIEATPAAPVVDGEPSLSSPALAISEAAAE